MKDYPIGYWLDMRDTYLALLVLYPDSVYSAMVVMEANKAIRDIRREENKNV